jgi:acetyl-CoA acetyltransferase
MTDERVCIDALGLSQVGKAHELVANGDITFGGKYLINPSGGLISKGHPIGATGLAQASELVHSLSLEVDIGMAFTWVGNKSCETAYQTLSTTQRRPGRCRCCNTISSSR